MEFVSMSKMLNEEGKISDTSKRIIDEHINTYYRWVDGPCGYYFERPSVAKTIIYHSRDLILEAFENGHTHAIHC